MGLRFRKSVNMGGGVRLNFSKSGMGFSAGTKGARITKKANGGLRSTASIPGTGISYVNETGSRRNSNTCPKSAEINAPELTQEQASSVLYWVCFAMWLPMVLLSLLLCLIFPLALIGVAIGVVEFIYVHKTRKRRKQNR